LTNVHKNGTNAEHLVAGLPVNFVYLSKNSISIDIYMGILHREGDIERNLIYLIDGGQTVHKNCLIVTS
jgi:hypothetical protein